MDRLKALAREPALLIDFGETLIIFLIAFGVDIHGDQQDYLVAFLIALVGLIKAFTTKPFPVTMITDFGRAALVLAASLGLGVTADQIAVTVTMLGTLTTVVARSQITPRSDPVVAYDGAGAGPVASVEAGYGALATVGLGLVVLGLILLLLSLLQVILMSLTVPVVLIVIGLVLWFVGGRTP